MTQRFGWMLVLLLAVGLSLPALAGTRHTEYLVVSNPRVIKLTYAIGNVTIGNPQIVDFRADRPRNRIALLPKSTGTTLLIIYDTKGVEQDVYELTVYPSDPEHLLQQVRQLLVDVEGITITRVDDKIVIDGQLILPADKDRIRKISGNSKAILDLTKLNPDTDSIIAKKIQKEIGMDEVNVRALKGRVLLEGEVYSKSAYQKAEKIASLFSPNIVNVLEIRELPQAPSRQPTIQVTAHFVEVAKNFARHFNFRFNPIPQVGSSLNYSMNPVTGSDNFTGAITGTAADILPKLNYFKALGMARIIENPSVSVTSGDEAVIKSGTRVGFPLVQSNGVVSLDFHDVGAELTIRPFARGTDVDVDVNVEVSSLGSPEVTGGVAIERSSIKTSQFVRSGESVVIGGLVRYAHRRAIDKPPAQQGESGSTTTPASGFEASPDPFPLGSLFTLFKSNDVGQQRSQFLIFITPKILKFAKDANQEIKDQFNLYEVYPEELNRSSQPSQSEPGGPATEAGE